MTIYPDPNPNPPAGECSGFSAFVACVATSEFYHYFQTDHETPETVPWTGLESATRALRADHRSHERDGTPAAAAPGRCDALTGAGAG